MQYVGSRTGLFVLISICDDDNDDDDNSDDDDDNDYYNNRDAHIDDAYNNNHHHHITDGYWEPMSKIQCHRICLWTNLTTN